MEKALWYLLAGTRGGRNRLRIIRSLDERPRNANRLAETLDLDYNTVRHHLDMLIDHDVVESGGEDYGELYFLTDRFEYNRDAFARIAEQTGDDLSGTGDPEPTGGADATVQDGGGREGTTDHADGNGDTGPR